MVVNQYDDTAVLSPKAWKILGLTSLAVFAVYSDTTVLFVAFPSIQAAFSDISNAQLSWVLNAYTVVFAALLVPAGLWADRIGRRKVFLAGGWLFTLASVLCGISQSLGLLIGARILQAIGAAMIMPTSLALVLAAFPKSKRSTAIAIWGAAGALAAAIGPSIGAAIVQTGGWRWAFFFPNIPVGIAALILGRRILSESRDPEAQGVPDGIGVLLSIGGVGLVASAIIQSEKWGLVDSRTFATLLAGIVLLAAFIYRSSRVKTPAVDLTLFKDSNYRFANLATLVFYITFTAMFFGFVLFLTQVWGYSTLNAGLAITPGPLIVGFIAPLAGRIADARGHRILLVPGGCIFALGGLWLYIQAQAIPSFFIAWLPALLLTGIGIGLSLPTLGSASAHGLPPGRFAIGGAINQAIRQIGSVLGVALVIALVSNAPQSSILTSFDHIFALLIAGGLMTSLISLGIETKKNSFEYASGR